MRVFGSLLGNVVVGAALLLPCAAATAGVGMGNCDVHFASDFSVKPAGIHSTQKDTVYVLKSDGEVRVNGATLSLSADQRALVADYTGGVQSFMPDMVGLVADTLRTVGAAMGQALTGVFGADSEPARKIQASLAESEARLNTRMAENPGEYQVVNDRLDVLASTFDDDFDQSIEEAVEASMGGVMSMLSAALFGGDGSFGERMEAFGARMETFGEQVETREPALEKRAEALCEKAETIEKMEYRLRETIPELAHYRLMESRKKANDATGGGELRAE